MIHVNRRFIEWCRLHGINPGQTFITSGHLHLEDFAELTMKAYTSRVFTAYMAVCLRTLITNPAVDASADTDLQLICLATGQLANWMLDLETKPLELSVEQANSLYSGSMASLDFRIGKLYGHRDCDLILTNPPNERNELTTSRQVRANLHAPSCIPCAAKEPAISNESKDPCVSTGTK